MAGSLSQILAPIPQTLRDELVDALTSIERNFREGRWEPSELNGGKLSEVVYTILRGYVDNDYPAAASKPHNMVDACKALEQAGPQFPRSIRIQIPRMLTALYEIRNNRGVGHVGGDVNPNHMDAVCVMQMSKWIVAELIRVFHNVSTEEATEVVDSISERELALVWKVDGTSRVLDTTLSMTDKTLVLLYGSEKAVGEDELVRYIEHSNPSVFRRDVLRRAHSRRLIEYNASSRTATISPLGARYVEDKILSKGFAF